MNDASHIEPNINDLVNEIYDDLDDLRDALIAALKSYEKNLKDAIGHIPVWTEIKEPDVYSLFEIPEIEGAILGPRSVAIIAQSINDHIEDWLGEPDEIVTEKLSKEEVEEYRKSCAEVESNLLELTHNARRVTSEATQKLGEDLDSIMHRLDQEREHDENALKELLVDGSIERGKSARVEIADLWERYRSHAESLNSVWEELESLVFKGMDMVIAGIEDIRWIMRQSDTALTLINPELSPDYEVIDIPIRIEPRATFEIPREPSPKTMEIREPSARETIEIDRHNESVEKDSVNLLPKIEMGGLSELSEISEIADEFWGSRKILIPTPVPFFEVLIWAIPLITLIGFATGFVVNPDIIDELSVPYLPIIAGVILAFLILFPMMRKWNFTPSPKRRIQDVETIKIEITGQVAIDNVQLDVPESNLKRWSDEESAHFGWQLTINEFVIVGMETNLTRWQSGHCEIVSRDRDGWRLTKSEFRTLCRALSIPLI